MKKYFFIAILLTSIVVQAQEYLGIWSFESIDLTTMKKMNAPQDLTDLDKKILSNTNLFVSLKLNFVSDKVYSLNFMGQEQQFSYIDKEGVLQLRNDDKLVFLSNKKARLYTSDMVLILKKGEINIEKEYFYLTQESYESKEIDQKSLIGCWKVEEVRTKEGIEGAELQEMAALMITFNFINDKELIFGAMGAETSYEYSIDTKTNKLTYKDIKSGIEKSIFTVKELSRDHMIIAHNETIPLLYLIKV